MSFVCPKCKCTKIECVQSNASLTTPVEVVDGEVMYGQADVSDATTDRFQCENCGWTIPDVTDDDELIAWLTLTNG